MHPISVNINNDNIWVIEIQDSDMLLALEPVLYCGDLQNKLRRLVAFQQHQAKNSLSISGAVLGKSQPVTLGFKQVRKWFARLQMAFIKFQAFGGCTVIFCTSSPLLLLQWSFAHVSSLRVHGAAHHLCRQLICNKCGEKHVSCCMAFRD